MLSSLLYFDPTISVPLSPLKWKLNSPFYSSRCDVQTVCRCTRATDSFSESCCACSPDMPVVMRPCPAC